MSVLAAVAIAVGSPVPRGRISQTVQRLKSLGHEEPPASIPIWQTSPQSAWVKRDLDLPEITTKNVTSAIRSVVARRDVLEDGLSAELVASMPVYDVDPREPFMRSEYVQTSDMEKSLSYRGELSDRNGQTVSVRGARYWWRYSHEVMFDVPSTFVWPDEGVLDLAIFIEREGRVVAQYELTLEPVSVPRSTLAICQKPSYGPITPERLASMIEWREHSALMGVEIVHWSHREAALGETIAAWNAATGRRDTFTNLPPLDSTSWSGYFDEQVTVNDCFQRYRAASTYLAVMDQDEFLALDPKVEWNAEAVYAELRAVPENATSIHVKWAWTDYKRFDSISSSQLQDVDASLSVDDATRIAALQQTYDSYRWDYEPYRAFFFKTIHPTDRVLSASVHTAARAVSQGVDWKNGKAISEQDPILFAFQDTPGKLRLIHLKAVFEKYIPAAGYERYPVTPTMVAFWQKLADQIDFVKARVLV